MPCEKIKEIMSRDEMIIPKKSQKPVKPSNPQGNGEFRLPTKKEL
jgi:hypothetical protein